MEPLTKQPKVTPQVSVDVSSTDTDAARPLRAEAITVVLFQKYQDLSHALGSIDAFNTGVWVYDAILEVLQKIPEFATNVEHCITCTLKCQKISWAFKVTDVLFEDGTSVCLNPCRKVVFDGNTRMNLRMNIYQERAFGAAQCRDMQIDKAWKRWEALFAAAMLMQYQCGPDIWEYGTVYFPKENFMKKVLSTLYERDSSYATVGLFEGLQDGTLSKTNILELKEVFVKSTKNPADSHMRIIHLDDVKKELPFFRHVSKGDRHTITLRDAANLLGIDDPHVGWRGFTQKQYTAGLLGKYFCITQGVPREQL